MINTNYFLLLGPDDRFLVGRTDTDCQVCLRASLPDGTPARLIVAPANFVLAFRSRWIEKWKWTARQLLNRQSNLELYRQALIAWEEHRRSSLLF